MCCFVCWGYHTPTPPCGIFPCAHVYDYYYYYNENYCFSPRPHFTKIHTTKYLFIPWSTTHYFYRLTGHSEHTSVKIHSASVLGCVIPTNKRFFNLCVRQSERPTHPVPNTPQRGRLDRAYLSSIWNSHSRDGMSQYAQQPNPRHLHLAWFVPE